MELTPGTLLGGRYRVGALLGSGGMGSVYAGVQEGLNRKVALKVLHPHLSGERELIERFKREAHSIATLAHPNVVQINDFQTNEGEPPFIVMELLEGESLNHLLKRESQLPPERVAYIAVQVLSALGAAHRSNIVHRDIKPDNIYLSSTSVQADLVKVLDFGVAKVLRDDKDPKITRTGFVVGTLSYMAPEQAKGEPLDGRADLYSLGAVMYLALAGRKAFDAGSTPALVAQILRDSPVPLAAVRTDIDTKLSDIVMRALEKDRDKRFANAEAMATALTPFARATTAMAEVRPTDPHPHALSSVPTVRHAAATTEPPATTEPQAAATTDEDPISKAPEGQRRPRRTPVPDAAPETTLRSHAERKATLPSNLAPMPLMIQSSASLNPELHTAAESLSPAPEIVQASPAQRVHLPPQEKEKKSAPLLWLAITLVPLTLIALFGAFYVTKILLSPTPSASGTLTAPLSSTVIPAPSADATDTAPPASATTVQGLAASAAHSIKPTHVTQAPSGSSTPSAGRTELVDPFNGPAPSSTTSASPPPATSPTTSSTAPASTSSAHHGNGNGNGNGHGHGQDLNPFE